MAGENREVWARRVQAWQDSDLTCPEFSAKIGVNARTLTYWKWRLGREAGERKTGGKARKSAKPVGKPDKKVAKKRQPSPRAPTQQAPWVEVAAVPAGEPRVEVDLASGVTLKVPAGFDMEAVGQLVAMLHKVPA
jgi:hypothetical protein